MMKSMLTPRQIDCLRLLSEGLTAMMIANKLSISTHSVNKIFSAVCRRLKVRTRTQAVAIAIRLDLI